MFTKAVQDHPSASSFKGPTSFQRPRNHVITEKASQVNTLRSSPPAALNASRPFWSNISNSLKRTSSQANNEDYLGTRDTKMTRNKTSSPLPSSTDGERVSKLHDSVYFDENDFEDDADIDLDSEEPPSLNSPTNINVSYPSLPVKAHIPYPALTNPAKKSPSDTEHLSSSVRIPWSSSPLRDKPLPPSTSTGNGCKRRTLPWLNEETYPSSKAATAPEYVQKIIDRKRTKTDEGNPETRIGDKFAFTPLPKDKHHSPYPWNKTASAVKEEQKKHKKSMKNKETEDASKDSEFLKKKARVARIYLSEEQKKVLSLVTEDQKSVFFTGSAGTGKSVLLREIIKNLRVKHQTQPDRVAVTASTGLAACNIGGVTLHSFAGIGLGKEDVPELVRKIKRNQKAKTRWLRTKILIVDEISMVDGDLFDKLEGIARSIRNNGRPFGGIQLVITGDFFQLPPVPDYGKVSKFSFDAATWNTSIEHTIGLTQIFRQRDPVFANMLNEMRLGRLSSQSIDAFRRLNRPLGSADSFEATELFPTRQEVDNANNNRMRNLVGKSWDFRAVDGGSILDHAQRDKLLSNCMAPPLISLKKGAQVMLIKNIDETLVNGSVGRVVAFMSPKTFEYYHENEASFQAVETMDLNNEVEARSREKLKVLINEDSNSNTSPHWPLVQFAISDGSSRQLLCQPESWKIELPNGEVQASRSQIPLILAWALSIHKAQGQTLERVKVDLGKIFEKGQAYVALSRATCQEGLQILRFDPKKVMAHDKVRSFYNSLYSIDEASKAITETAPTKSVKTKGYGGQSPSGYETDDDDALLEMFG